MKLIISIEDYISGKTEGNSIVDECDSLMTKLDNLRPSERYSLAKCVGFAVIRAATISLHDETFIVFNDEQDLDENYDPYDWDAAYHTSIACANGGPWDASSNVEKRREFWLWYINEAVPKAFLSFE
jgi:hypothetical protein